MRNLAMLAAGSLLLWALLIFPAMQIGGEQGLLLTSAALALCLVPALATMAWALRGGTSTESQLLIVLGGTGVRMGVALGGGLLLHFCFPARFTTVFWVWLAVFYMFTLSLEMILLYRSQKLRSAHHEEMP